MIDKEEIDEKMKDAMKKIFANEVHHPNSSDSKHKITGCREIIEKAIK